MIRKFITGKQVYQGDVLPKGYGIAYWHMSDMIAVCYPWPLNLVVGFFYHLWWKIRHYPWGYMMKHSTNPDWQPDPKHEYKPLRIRFVDECLKDQVKRIKKEHTKILGRQIREGLTDD